MAADRGRSRLDARALSDLVWWADLAAAVGIGRTLWERPTVMSLDTDASPFGWGAVRDELRPAQGFFSLATRAYHINRKELLAVIYAIESFPSITGPGVVRVRTDWRVTMAVVNSLPSRSPRLMAEVIVCTPCSVTGAWASRPPGWPPSRTPTPTACRGSPTPRAGC